MASQTSSGTQPESLIQKAERAALSRWKLESLTGLLGIRALQSHQRESEKNMAAENRAVRQKLWGETSDQTAGDDMGQGHTILGDVVQHPPVIIAGQQSSSLGTILGAALAGASLLGIPGAGFAAYLYGKSQTAEPAKPQTTVIEQREDLGLGLLKLEDLQK